MHKIPQNLGGHIEKLYSSIQNISFTVFDTLPHHMATKVLAILMTSTCVHSLFTWKQRRRQSPTLLVLCEENPTVVGRFPLQRASSAGSVFKLCQWRIMLVALYLYHSPDPLAERVQYYQYCNIVHIVHVTIYYSYTYVCLCDIVIHGRVRPSCISHHSGYCWFNRLDRAFHEVIVKQFWGCSTSKPFRKWRVNWKTSLLWGNWPWARDVKHNSHRIW